MRGYTVTEISLVRDFQSFYYAMHTEYSREQHPLYSLLNRVDSSFVACPVGVVIFRTCFKKC